MNTSNESGTRAVTPLIGWPGNVAARPYYQAWNGANLTGAAANPMMGAQVLTLESSNAQWGHIPGHACPGCGMAYLTQCSGAGPHNPAACVAFKRGYEAGLAVGKSEGAK